MKELINQSTTLRQQLASIVGAIPFGIVVVSDFQEVEIINTIALDLLGLSSRLPGDVVDQHYEQALASLPNVMDQYRNLILAGKRQTFSTPCRCGDGSRDAERDLYITCQKMLQGTLFVIEDKTEKKALIHQMSHDYLTQLLNRQSFEKILGERLSNGVAVTSTVLALIDLDRFKIVNDVAGHACGDEILKRVTTAIIGCVSDHDEVARIGGDEFAVLFNDCSVNRAKDVLNVILKKVENINLIHAGQVLNVSLSAGVAPLDPAQYRDVSQLVNAAETACRLAKADNEERIHVIDSADDEYAAYLQDTSMLNAVNQAIENNTFYLVAQQIAPLNEAQQHQHYEILLRLLSEEGDNIPPNLFIPVAERSRIMSRVDRWVIAETFSTITPGISVSINLSGQSLSDMTLASFIMELTQRYQIDAAQVSFEITETAAIEHIEKTQHFIKVLREEGFTFSLDDFGTGLSSYQYLKNLPFDYIKIDGMFVKDIGEDDFSRAMVGSINDFAHTIGIQTIAEFASSQLVVDKLTEMGVDYAQGFHIHKPEPLVELVAALQPV